MLNREEVISEALLELIRQEEALAEADRSLELAQGRYKLAAKRYAAVRDAVVEILNGVSPYGDPTDLQTCPTDPDSADGHYYFESPAFGKYKYLYKSVGEAVGEALRTTVCALTLGELVAALEEGHLYTDARAVNASLLNMKGVEKLPGGRYLPAGRAAVTSAVTSDDDLPF